MPDIKQYDLSIDDLKTRLDYVTPVGVMNLTANTETIGRQFYKKSITDTGLLPPVVRYLSEDFSKIIIERPPAQVNIFMRMGEKGKIKDGKPLPIKEWRIWVPWLVYVFSVNPDFTKCRKKSSSPLKSFHIYARPEQLQTEEDTLYFPCFPNLFAEGSVCVDQTSTTLLQTLDKNADLPQYLNALINNFWSATFNLDLDTFFAEKFMPSNWDIDTDSGRMTIVRNLFDHWSKLSSEEILQAKWKPIWSLKDCIQKLESSTQIVPKQSDTIFDLIYNLLFYSNKV